MKIKTYTFTENEMTTLRNALIEYYQMIKGLEPLSPIAIDNQKNARVLKDQFIADVSDI